MCEDNCILLTNVDVQEKGNVITLQDNDDTVLVTSGDGQDPATFSIDDGALLLGEVPVTITERLPNSGTFGTYDDLDVSNIIITDDANRGTSAFIDSHQ